MKTILREEGFPLALFPTYMAMIRGSVHSEQYHRLFVDTPDGPKDVIGNGDLACAYFVSAILVLCELTQGGVHTTVTETLADLVASGWYPIEVPREGCIVVWGEKLCTDGVRHRHIGFCTGVDEAISSRPKDGGLRRHPLIETDVSGQVVRPIESLYSHSRLELSTAILQRE